MQAEILAGPYNLTHKKLAGDTMVLRITGDNVVVTSKLEKGKLTNEKKRNCKDFEEAIGILEQMIETYSMDYTVNEGDAPAAVAKRAKGAAAKI